MQTDASEMRKVKLATKPSLYGCGCRAQSVPSWFVSFVSRHPQHTLAQIREALGWPYHWPQVYFRFGFVLMVASLSLFFIMVMDVLEMSGCLAFCVATIILPMCYAMTRAFSIFAIEEVDLVVVKSTRSSEAKRPRAESQNQKVADAV